MRNAASHRSRVVSGSASSPGCSGSLEQLLGPSSSPSVSLDCAFALASAFQGAEHLVVKEHEIMCSNNLEMLNHGHLDQLQAACSCRLGACMLYIQKLELGKLPGKLK